MAKTMYQKRAERKKEKIASADKPARQVAISWFPGHMAKAKREISESMKLIDIVFELIDARIPVSSRNPMVDEIVGKKPRLILLAKANLADKKKTADWIDYYANKGIVALDIDSITGYHLNMIVPKAKVVLAPLFEA